MQYPQGYHLEEFTHRHKPEDARTNDWRTPYYRDMARIIHGGAFRRLQGKTQVMGAGEGDFHRTRLTHSLEVHQIGRSLFEGILQGKLGNIDDTLKPFLKDAGDVISAACYAHDLGHPPFGHGGERALHQKMHSCGGFEGNAQTVSILTELEKHTHNLGINPTRRVLLSVLKYPVAYHNYPQKDREAEHPPKCFFDHDEDTIDWALKKFSESDRSYFTALDSNNKAQHKTFDASIMDCADDIAFCSHDLEDIIAREFISKDTVIELAKGFWKKHQIKANTGEKFDAAFFDKLYNDSCERKAGIGTIVNTLMTSTRIRLQEDFEHPLLRFRLVHDDTYKPFIKFLKTDLTYNEVIAKPEIQMLERKGQRIISALFDEYISHPKELIPDWEKKPGATDKRKVCNYIAGMTDAYANKIYHRMFTPGYGSSTDEF